MACTAATLLEELPAFASLTEATVQKWLDRAALEMNPDVWGTLYDEGHMFLAAHKMVCMSVLPGVSASAGAVKSKSVGPVSVTYATSDGGSVSDNDLERTAYGRQHKAMRATLLLGPLAL